MVLALLPNMKRLIVVFIISYTKITAHHETGSLATTLSWQSLYQQTDYKGAHWLRNVHLTSTNIHTRTRHITLNYSQHGLITLTISFNLFEKKIYFT